MRTALTMLLAAMSISLAVAEPLQNTDFAQAAGDASIPAHWDVPEGSAWQRETGGPDDGSVLAWSGEGVAPPVVQRADFLTPGAGYRLSATLHSDGTLRPLVRAVDLASGEPLASIVAEATEVWQELRAEFEAQSADVRVEIFADARHVERADAPRGAVAVARVALDKVRAKEQPPLPDLGENVALGVSYTMAPPPSYGYCTDEGDAVQLTDGEYTEGHFWTRPTTVGWSGVSPKYVTIDLGQDRPIRGMSFGTAAGVAGVHWPARILIFVSEDGQTWYEVADLVELHTQREELPPFGEYAERRLWTGDLHTHGRFVKLFMEPTPNYLFVDEIQVFRGDEAWLSEPLDGSPITEVEQHMETVRITGLIQDQFRCDLDPIGDDIRRLPLARRQPFEVRAMQLAEEIDEMEPIPMEDFVAILPMTDLERRIFGLQADVWRAQGKPQIRLWDQHRWDPLAPSAEPGPDAAAAAVELHMMANEYRADVFNITNASDRDLRLRITGLPGGPNPDWISVHEVLHVGTRWFTAVAAALPEADRVGEDYLVTVPAGMVRQVWIALNRPDLEPGTYAGSIRLSAATGFSGSVPIRVRIYPLRFPDQTTLLVGGWSYTNATAYGLTPQNRAEIIDHLQSHYVNAPWATRGVLQPGEYDAEGNMVARPQTWQFDEWQAAWPDARMYMVFMAVGDSFDGSRMGTEVFNRKVGAWARFWADHMRELGLDGNQLGLLLVDEPHDREQYETIVGWAKAIEAAAPEIVTWEDPQPPSLDEHVVAMFESVDVLCPYRRQYMTRGQWYTELLAEQQAAGKDLWFYSADGPARSFDPFSYYLMQEWHAFGIGAMGSCFWCFTDNGRVSCWNEYTAQGNGPYCPTYIDDTSNTPAKYMEAIREGVEDYEYLTMLRSRVEELEGRGVQDARLTAARKLLDTAVGRVMAMDVEPSYTWDEPKDRAVQDRVRIQILQALTALSEL
ncbi:MAG: hypothetical protein U9R79_02775 [Armatimonadota bacterium]|nr:hypothetical protein [Armatimonadota bacterium]